MDLLFNVFLPPAYVVRREGTVFTGVHLLTFRGVPGPGRGDPSLRSEGVPVSDLGGSQVQVGGSQSQIRGGGSQVQVQGESQSQIQGRVPSLSKGKNF